MEHKKKQTLEQLVREGANGLPEGVGLPGVQARPPS